LHEREEKFHYGGALYKDVLSLNTLANIVYTHVIEYEFYDICRFECDQCKKMYKEELLDLDRDELLKKIYDIDQRTCEQCDSSLVRHEMALLNGFITTTNRDWIDEQDDHFLYDLPIDDAIEVQDQLITELLNANLYHSCRGCNMTLDLLYRDITDEEAQQWYMGGDSFDDGWRGL
jgi:hypothetical protein